MIQKTITIREPLPKLEKLTRVAAYARVSSGKDAMLHSLAAQISYYQKLITTHQGWEYAGVYADEALTGTKDDREEFQRLIQDCKDGKIDLIIVKAISRFARNTVTLLETVRMLKSINVDVYFEEQNLHTMSAEGEMVLTFLASFAQEESRSVSENMKWRIKKDFEAGLIWGSKDNYGYQIVDKKLVIVPEQAEVVRRIFSLYLEGFGFQKIANILNEENVPTMRGSIWHKTTIDHIINNYNYTGNLILQKTYRTDYLSKKKKRNKGEVSQYLVEDSHEPIISLETFILCQDLKRERSEYYKTKKEENAVYPFTMMIKCGVCGKGFRRKHANKKILWTCCTYNTRGREFCNSKSIPETVLIDLTKEVLGVSEVTRKVVISKIIRIEAFNGNKVVFHLKDGQVIEKVWKDITRRDSWTPEMKEAARQRSLAQHRKDGKKNG